MPFPGARTATASRIIGNSVAELYPLFADVNNVVKWNAGVKSIDLLSTNPSGVGASRRCHLSDGTSVKEECIQAVENSKILMQMSEFSLPLSNLQMQIDLEVVSEASTKVTFTMFYKMKYGFVGSILHALAGVNKNLTTACTKFGAGVSRHARTGETVGADFKPEEEPFFDGKKSVTTN